MSYTLNNHYYKRIKKIVNKYILSHSHTTPYVCGLRFTVYQMHIKTYWKLYTGSFTYFGKFPTKSRNK